MRIRLVVERLLERLQPVEKMADLRVHELLVRDSSDGGHRLGTRGVAAGRHHDLLVPAEHANRLAQIGDLGKALLERAKVRVHLFGLYPPR